MSGIQLLRKQDSLDIRHRLFHLDWISLTPALVDCCVHKRNLWRFAKDCMSCTDCFFMRHFHLLMISGVNQDIKVEGLYVFEMKAIYGLEGPDRFCRRAVATILYQN